MRNQRERVKSGRKDRSNSYMEKPKVSKEEIDEYLRENNNRCVVFVARIPDAVE